MKPSPPSASSLPSGETDMASSRPPIAACLGSTLFSAGMVQILILLLPPPAETSLAPLPEKAISLSVFGYSSLSKE